MDAATEQRIIEAGVPIDYYKTGILSLGPYNRKALMRMANINSIITKENLPIPPSLFIEFVCNITGGKDKLDYRITLDGEPGTGKSVSAFWMAVRYAIEMSEREQDKGHDKVPQDYFTLNNVALLQDTAGLTRLLAKTGKHQAVIVDDAGIAAGNRAYMTQDNKDIDAIMQTCRTKRWFMSYNSPNRRHVDVHVRELVYAKAHIYKPFHAAGFNVIKILREQINLTRRRNNEYQQHFTLGGKKTVFYAQFSTDILDDSYGYAGLMDKYDAGRDVATDQLLAERANQSEERKNPTSKRQEWKQDWEKKVEKWYHHITSQIIECEKSGEKFKRSKIRMETGLSDPEVIKMISLYKTRAKI
jgi:hypothetical protein